jgi:hypothetical protein
MKITACFPSIAILAFGLVAGVKAQSPSPTPRATPIPQFTNSTAFFNAITSSNYTETYNSGFTYQQTPNSPLSFSNNGFSYTAFTGSGNFYMPGLTNVTPTDLWLSVFDPTTITFTNFSANISAIGGNFFTTDFSGGLTNAVVSIIATFASGPSFTTNYTAGTIDTFLGLTFATNNIISLTISAADGQYPTINNFTVGVVPEPSTFALLGLAAAGLAGYVVRRRRR